MSCKKPILVGPDGFKSLVRCGKCNPCRIRRKQAWVGRMLLESLDHPTGRFLTLTYADPAKQDAQLDYADLQGFMKRYVYYHGSVRFYAIGEYGEKNGNAHWHLIMFGHPSTAPREHLLMKKPPGVHWVGDAADRCWPHGFKYDGWATLASMGYCAAYAMKTLPRGRRNVSGMSRSPGIGLGRVAKLGAAAAASLAGSRLGQWPGRFSLIGKSYPLMEGSLYAFQNAFLEAGGIVPLSLSPDDRHTVSMEQFGHLGDQLLEWRAAESDFKFRNGFFGLVPNGQTKL